MTLEIGHPEDAQTAGVHEELVVTVADPEEPHVEEAVVGVALALDLQPSAGFEEGIGGAGVQGDRVGELHQGRGEGAEQP